MSDGDQLTYLERKSRISMQDRTLLDIRSAMDRNLVVITTDHCARPYRNLLGNVYVTDDYCMFGYVSRRMNFRRFVPKSINRHDLLLLFG
ncbi:hypothetical protein LMG31506_05070 [Cupriavidus yeoncheonensis]|uniref:Uncharacterized protein n=1 Tax=Cupriavidus yeoncheonensis TaxID=1462994 RepID=A0A916IYF4_9BURK|nr:hypothetical protein LMG31506_05070 [Cupriavidus yeoncheonensis]